MVLVDGVKKGATGGDDGIERRLVVTLSERHRKWWWCW